jgi:putative ABC transport system permease protein
VLLAIAAGMALLLSAVGLYGVIASIVNYRRPELGIRLALGATEGGVLRLVLQQSARLVGIGIAAGVLGAFAVSRVMQAVLFGVLPNDPLVLVGAAGVLMLTGTVASLVPAYRASQLPPRLAMQGD